ncbi:MAG: MFS transporter [bacterium]|nr:MFS transporter [Deltaproteobacteria bacterium]MCP4908635.1 MFS transporter [bacterium]
MFQGWWIVGTHFTAQLFVSGFFIYSLPLLFPAVIVDFSTDATTVNLLPSAASLLGLVVAPLTGPLVDRWSARGLMIIGTLCLVLGLLGLSFAQSILQFVVIGAVFFSIAQILLGPLAGSAVVSRWFTSTRGRALGIAAIGTSIGGILLPKGLGQALSTVGWRTGLQGIALASAVFVLPLLVFRFWDQPSDRGVEAEADGEAAGAPQTHGELATNKEILTRPAFWLFTLSLGFFLASYTATLANIGQFCADLGFPADAAENLIPVLALCGIFGKLGFGYLADRIPLKVGLIAAIGTTGLSLVLFSLEPSYSVMLVAAAAMGVASGGILPVWNAIVPVIFGVQNFGRAMGWMMPVIGILVTPSYLIAGAIRDSSGSYVLAFQVFLGVLGAAVLLILPLRVVGEPAS